MDELRDIYGVDAKALAGLQKGRVNVSASGVKRAKDGKGPDEEGLQASRYSDMSFRST